MGTIIALANQKGGVAKTTTVQSLADAFAEMGRSVLVVDLDPQACLTYAMGVEPDRLDLSLYDVFMGTAKLDEILIELDSATLAPASIDLAGAEVHLLTKTGREFVLARALRPLAEDHDYVLVDCGPSLGILTINGLTAANWVAIPFQAETLSDRAVGQLLETVQDVRMFTNEDLRVLGAVATVYDGRTRLAREVVARLPRTHGIAVLEPPIPKSVRVAEAPARSVSVLGHAGRSKSAEAYRALARTIEGAL
jgi:chromosome partitioning protein